MITGTCVWDRGEKEVMREKITKATDNERVGPDFPSASGFFPFRRARHSVVALCYREARIPRQSPLHSAPEECVPAFSLLHVSCVMPCVVILLATTAAAAAAAAAAISMDPPLFRSETHMYTHTWGPSADQRLSFISDYAHERGGGGVRQQIKRSSCRCWCADASAQRAALPIHMQPPFRPSPRTHSTPFTPC